MVILSGEDPTAYIESLPFSNHWAVGPVNRDSLQASAYARVRQPYIGRFRTVPVANTFTVGTQNATFLLPESLQTVLGLYLRVKLAAIPAEGQVQSQYRIIPGMRVLRNVRVLSAGQQVLECDMRDVLTDYLTNLEEQTYESFCDTHLGGRSATFGETTVLIPVPLWNSAIFSRSALGHLGALPCAGFGNNRLEIQFDFAAATSLTNDHTAAPAFTSCQMEIYEAMMPAAAQRSYANQNGKYSLISRAFRRLSNSDQLSVAANTEVSISCNAPGGAYEEIIIAAVKNQNGNLDEIDMFDYATPTEMALVCDSRNVRTLDTDQAHLEQFANGFTSTANIKTPIRFCLGTHTRAYGANSYSGAFSFDAVSDVTIKLKFAEQVFVRILGICKARYTISANGEVTQSLR